MHSFYNSLGKVKIKPLESQTGKHKFTIWSGNEDNLGPRFAAQVCDF